MEKEAEKVRAVIYVRVCEALHEIWPEVLENIKKRLIRDAENQGYKVTGCYCEICGADKMPRPLLESILCQAKFQQINIVLISNYGQISRDINQVFLYSEQLKKYGVQMIVQHDQDRDELSNIKMEQTC